jgi:flagellar hook-associated protein 1 FlgK
MGSLFSTLRNTTGTLQVYNRAFNVIQNNISNANTPGYARQDLTMIAMPFDPANQLLGGVLPGPMLSARSEYLEQAVRNRQEYFGKAQQQSLDLAQIESQFDPAANAGIAGAFSRFFNSFSQLAVNPNNAVARRAILEQAGQAADSFHRAATGISQAATSAGRQIRDAVSAINRLGTQIANINARIRSSASASNDAGLDAQLYTALEELSGIANYTLIRTADGSANIYLGGQTALVIGDHFFQVSADFAGAQTAILDWQGKDITSQMERGKLGGLLEEKNVMLPGYLTSLHQLAQSFADTVNAALAAGVDKNGVAPTVNLFSYNTAADAAASIAVTGITPDEIAAALPSAPGGNGNALAIAALADAPAIGGLSFTQFYGDLGARVGRDISAAKLDSSQFQDAVVQARAQRQDQAGVSLDEEAAKLLQFQQAYQAAGKMVGVLDTLTDTLLNLIR